MPKLKLTAKFIEGVEVQTRTDFWDTLVAGLVLRVSPPTSRTPAGNKVWNCVFTRSSDGSKVRQTLGKWPHLDLERARGAALAAMAEVAAGGDPSSKRRLLKESATLGDLIDAYLEKYAKLEKRSWAEDQRLLGDSYVDKKLRATKLASLRKADFLDIFDAKVQEGKIATARALHAVFRKMLNWAAERDLLETSPLANVKAPGKPPQRDRVLTDAELGQIWNTLNEKAMSVEMREVIRLLVLLGSRVAEVAEMSVGEVDLEKGEWLLPAERAKNGRQHLVPLPDLATEILRTALSRHPDADSNSRIFSRGGTAITPNGVAQAVRKKLQVLPTRWTAHDLRRTFATRLAENGVAPHVVEALINHVSGFRSGVAGVYNRATYGPEKRAALIQWETHLLQVAGTRKNVVISLTKRKDV